MATMVTRTRINDTLYLHCLSCWTYIWTRGLFYTRMDY